MPSKPASPALIRKSGTEPGIQPRNHILQRGIGFEFCCLAPIFFRACNVLPHLTKHNRIHCQERLRTRSGILHQHISDQTLHRNTRASAEIPQRGQRVGHGVACDLRFEVGMRIVRRPAVTVGFEVHKTIYTVPEMKVLSGVCFLTLAIGPLFAQHSFTPVDVEEGGRLYRANCSICHGAQGDGVSGTDLGHNKFRRASSDDDIANIIRTGIPGTAMPPHTFSDFQSLTIVAYLRSIASATATTTSGGNAIRGKTIFEGKGGCTGCHRVRGVGSRVGPDLSDIGNLRLGGELERSLSDPDAEILAQNRYFRAVTKDGETIVGRLLNEDRYSVQLLDSKERLVSLKRANLRESAFVEKSSMPSYKDKLSSGELADLVSYLVSLKGVEIP
jgi:cytochrome c oxidase cbb3-type subunit III